MSVLERCAYCVYLNQFRRQKNHQAQRGRRRLTLDGHLRDWFVPREQKYAHEWVVAILTPQLNSKLRETESHLIVVELPLSRGRV
eukprot:2884758-Amphidinium_carterae.1